MRDNQNSEAASSGKKMPLALMAVLAVSFAAGGAIGGVLIGPRLTSAAPVEADGGDASGAEHGKNKKGVEHGSTSLYTLESLVVNPAGTAGTRFLILSLAIDVRGSTDPLKNQEARLRDVLLSVLAAKSIEELADIAQRDTLKKELLESIRSTVSGVTVTEIYFPQYVLQ